MERLTLDMTTIRDATEEKRAGPGAAVELLALAESAEGELGVPPQGARPPRLAATPLTREPTAPR